MEIGRLMFGEVIRPIVNVFVPIYLELPLLYLVDHVVETHVIRFAAILAYVPIEESISSGLVYLQRNGAFYVPHFV